MGRRQGALGLGRTIPSGARTLRAIRAVVRAVLCEPRYREKAARLQAEMRALPGPAHAVALLAQLLPA